MADRPVLILGGGINGAAAARELALNGLSVWLVDANDLSYGATAYSSRLIHGGLRYLEFREFSLVRESLDERARLLKLAPHLVKPLRLFIPVRNQFGGLIQAAGKFLGWPSRSKKTAHRGRRVVQLGLWLYDVYSRGGSLPPRSLHRPGDAGVPQVSPRVAKRLWAYSDAQITYPERMVIGMLHDARENARQKGSDFRVLTYTRATLHGTTLELAGADDRGAIQTLEPAAIVNATGAWVDATLTKLDTPSPRLMGGTKGSHFVTFQNRLAEMLQGQAIYTEASDGRPVFLLPLGAGALVGTTDIPFEGDPATAVATEAELKYLLGVVNDVFPDARLNRGDIAMHQCGVRPLPFADAKTTAAITRRHRLVWNEASAVPLLSLVGGKLTTCRSLAEETAASVLSKLGRKPQANSRERPIPATLVDRGLLGKVPLAGQLPELARAAVIDEWAQRLEDVVERRLMLHFSQHLSRETLVAIAAELVQLGKLPAADSQPAVERCTQRLRNHFGIDL